MSVWVAKKGFLFCGSWSAATSGLPVPLKVALQYTHHRCSAWVDPHTSKPAFIVESFDEASLDPKVRNGMDFDDALSLGQRMNLDYFCDFVCVVHAKLLNAPTLFNVPTGYGKYLKILDNPL